MPCKPEQIRIALVVTAFACVSILSTSSVWAQRGPAVVEVKPIIKRENLAPVQTIVGTVEATRKAVVGSAVDGRIIEMLVREGDRVEQDQPLARLLTETIQREIEAAAAELELKNQVLAELKNGSRPEEIAQAKARLNASRVVADYRNRDRERLTALRSRSATSQSDLEDAVSLALESQQLYAEAQAAHDLAVAGARVERIAQAQAEVAIRQANLLRLQEQRQKHTMYSRFAGYVTVEHTEVGQWVARGEPVAEIIALDEVFVVVKVPETQIPLVNVGNEVQIEVSALPNNVFTGKIAAVIPQADVRSRTFPVKIRLKNSISSAGEPLLKAGMLARVKLPVGESKPALLVGKDALVLGGASPIVWSIDLQSIETSANGMHIADAIAIPVTTGNSEGALIEVMGRLEDGALIVVRGNERIPPSPPGQPPPKVTWQASD
ncbi:MAG: efflux RND transporter periplasmic adaptor subunit [Planctomycetales bacterium]|nr:efflux RND transporter periplasmic adaptor subunit [Planctomycetales bacterium]